MIAYDKRVYYNKAREPFIDPEWEEAEAANEEPEYYWVFKKIAKEKFVKYIKCYKPSIAKLVHERTGYVIVPIFNHHGLVRSYWSKDTVEHKRR